MLFHVTYHTRRAAFSLLEVMISLAILTLFTVGFSYALLSLNSYVPRARHLTSADSMLWSQIGQALTLNYTVGTGTNANPGQLAEVLKTSADAVNATVPKATAGFDYPAGTYTFSAATQPPYRSVFQPSFEEFDGRDYTATANPFGANKAWRVAGVPIYVSASPNRADIAASPERITPVVPGNLFRQVTLTDTLAGNNAKFYVDSQDANQKNDLGVRIVDVAVTYTYNRGTPTTVTMSTFRAPN